MLKWLVLPMVVLAYLASTVSAAAPRDRDHDRLPDRWERKHHLSTAKPSAKRDPDRDSLKNRRELRLRTHPRRADTDHDRLRDGAEVRRFHTNPRKRDTDGDGFSDRCELRKGTNPRKRRSHPKRRCSNSPQEPRRQVPPRPPANDPDGDGFVGSADLCANEPGAAPDGCHGIVISGGGGDSGHFGADCFYSHTNHDDPIVFPGGVGAAHMHDFINNATTNAFTTNDSLRASGSTNCVRHESGGTERNFSSYWVPALIVDGAEVRPGSGEPRGQIGALYTLNRRRAGNVQPFPADFKVIAGRADGGPVDSGDQRLFRWECEGGVVQPPASPGDFPTCGTGIRLNIRFGDCSDGRSDSPNHRDHVAYSRVVPGSGETRICPSSHPIPIPMLQLHIRYATRAGPTAHLSTIMTSSGNTTTTHADFMNGWDMDLLQRLVNNCINVNRYCGGQDTPVPGHP